MLRFPAINRWAIFGRPLRGLGAADFEVIAITPRSEIASLMSLAGKVEEEMAEGTGLEPASPCGRRISRPLHYQLCYPSESLAVDDSVPVSVRSTCRCLWGS